MKNIFWKKCHTLYLLYIGIGIIGIVIGRYEKFHIGILSVSADKKIEFIGLYRYRLIWKKAYRSYTALAGLESKKHSPLLGWSMSNFRSFWNIQNLDWVINPDLTFTYHTYHIFCCCTVGFQILKKCNSSNKDKKVHLMYTPLISYTIVHCVHR